MTTTTTTDDTIGGCIIVSDGINSVADKNDSFLTEGFLTYNELILTFFLFVQIS